MVAGVTRERDTTEYGQEWARRQQASRPLAVKQARDDENQVNPNG